ncbi:MAG TPA: GNAT family protein [Stellaceae bacterium]|nr:GNAT family protein [Stellaceae bacterium]
MSIEIRPARVEDIPSLYRCLDAVAREERYLAFVEAPPLEASRAFWGKMIEQQWPFQVAVDGSEAIGWCDISPNPRPALSHGGTLGMGLLGAQRGRGIGRRLLAATVEDAWRFGLERVELTVLVSNVHARRLYEAVGFHQEGVLHQYWKVRGQREDCLLMALLRSRREQTTQ